MWVRLPLPPPFFYFDIFTITYITADITDYKYEHILMAEDMLDRKLKPGEEVHHLDKNRTNNSPDNLLVLSGWHACTGKPIPPPNEEEILKLRNVFKEIFPGKKKK